MRRFRLYTKRVPPQRLYFSERNRHGRWRLLKLGSLQLWLMRRTPAVNEGYLTGGIPSDRLAQYRAEGSVAPQSPLVFTEFDVPEHLEPYVEPVPPERPPAATERHLRVVEPPDDL